MVVKSNGLVNCVSSPNQFIHSSAFLIQMSLARAFYHKPKFVLLDGKRLFSLLNIFLI